MIIWFAQTGGGSSGPTKLAKVNTSLDSEVLALTASFSAVLFDCTGATGAQGVVFVYNNGPNAIEISSTGTTANTKGIYLAAGGYYVIDSPGGQKWWVRAYTANQVAGAATNVEGWYLV